MTTSINLLIVFADVTVLLALAGAVASRGVSSLARAVLATFAFLGAWLMTAVLDAIHAPGWTILLGGALIAANIVAISATLHLWAREGDCRDDAPGQPGDHGGDGPGRGWPDAPPPGGGGSDPTWWPKFEQQLAAYVAGREANLSCCRCTGSVCARRAAGTRCQFAGSVRSRL
jgi:hypothetical protein